MPRREGELTMKYVISAGYVHEGKVVYEGEHDPSEVICTIKWCIADLLDMMAREGVELTDENIDRILEQRFERTLQERSTEDGWETIQVLVWDADGLTYRKETNHEG